MFLFALLLFRFLGFAVLTFISNIPIKYFIHRDGYLITEDQLDFHFDSLEQVQIIPNFEALHPRIIQKFVQMDSKSLMKVPFKACVNSHGNKMTRIFFKSSLYKSRDVFHQIKYLLAPFSPN